MFIKKIFRNAFLFCLLTLAVCLSYNLSQGHFTKQHSTVDFSSLQDGDIVFQVSESGQGKAIQLATHSKYTHCGIVFKENNTYMVYEAVQPVRKIALKDWVKNGQDNYYTARRLKTASATLTPAVIAKMKAKYKQFEGKNYDLYFGWSDEKIYCSELVWKLYNDATGLELGQLQKLKDFDLSSPVVQYKLKERYGEKIPYEEMVISPARIFESELLSTVN